jgi:peptidoglycan glycosyltransferase
MNTQIRRLALGLIVLYVALFVQLNLLQIGKQEVLTNDSRNTRATVRDFNKPRGDIVSADGVVVATSTPTEPGSDFAFQRSYPTGELFSHLTGYYTFVYGATQVEKVRNDVLAGRTPEQQLRGITSLWSEPDTSGSVVLTVDSRIQQAARDQLGDREGSVVVLDTATGAVKAMWSYPTYDPNLIAVHDSELAGDTIRFYDAAPGKPLLANTYQERYMPGSVFKVLTTSIGLDSGNITLESEWEDESEWTPPQTTDPIENYNGTVCGGDLAEVFRRSCNTPFARMAVDMGAPTMVSGTKGFGIGEPVPLDLPRPAASYFGEVETFENAIPKLAISGFGQDEVQMVPMHMAMVAATVANDGEMMKPFVVDKTLDNAGRLLETTKPELWKRPMSKVTADTLTLLMVGVVNDGTASCCMQLANGVQAAAKTGTAQLNAAGEEERSHAWIVAFAPAEAPRYAIAVMLKGTTAEISAGTGGTLAGPVAREVLNVALATG